MSYRSQHSIVVIIKCIFANINIYSVSICIYVLVLVGIRTCDV